MITYTSSDIVRRATQLADIENSDFVSFNEKIALLNENYVSVYQKLIDRGDDYFLRIKNIKENVFHLPPDFHQLKAVNLIASDGYRTQVLRRPANQRDNELSYDLRNNTLVINGNTQGATVCIEYYPVPQTLTFPSPKLPLDVDGTVAAMHGTLYLTVSDGTYTLHDLNDSDISEDITVSGVSYVHMEDDYITFVTSSGATYYSLYTGTSTIQTTGIPAFYKGRTFVYSDGSLLFPATLKTAYSDVTLDVSTCSMVAVADDLAHFAGISSGALMAGTTDSHETVDIKATAANIALSDNTVYITTGTDYVAVWDMYYSKLHETIMDAAVVDVIGFNENTGYGYLTKKLGSYAISSFFEDTSLNFPNNIYFTLIAYYLAIAFKSKQGSDTSQLLEMAANAEATFYDTLTRDDWGSVRITNAY